MYVKSMNGMGALNCPGDPGCPGYVAPGSADYQTSLLQAILANQVAAQPADTTGTTVGPADMAPQPSMSSWLNTNSTMLMWAGAGLVGVVLLARLGR